MCWTEAVIDKGFVWNTSVLTVGVVCCIRVAKGRKVDLFPDEVVVRLGSKSVGMNNVGVKAQDKYVRVFIM